MQTDVIREIQDALRRIARFDPRIPLVAVDGFYGAQTARAVAIFQDLNDLPATGEVDSVTFRRLQDDAAAVTNTVPLAIPVFLHPAHLLRPYEQTPLVPFVKLMLNALAEEYTNLPVVDINDRYDEPAVEAVRIIQRLHLLEDNGVVDHRTWDILVTLYAKRSSLNAPPRE